MSDLISINAAIGKLNERQRKLIYLFGFENDIVKIMDIAKSIIIAMPSSQPEIIHCKDCKHWRQQTNYAGAPLSFGFCESDDMWQSLYGETYEVSHIDTDDDFYCGYAERKR